MSKIAFAITFCLFLGINVYAETGFEYQLDIKKRTGIYSDTALSFDQVVIDITKLNPMNDGDAQDERIRALFDRGSELWQAEGAKQQFMIASQYGYRNLCDAVVAYYNSVGRIYKSVPYLRSLVDDSARIYLVDVQAESSIRLIDIYLTLGQAEAAKELISSLKAVIDDFFITDADDIEESDPYSIIVYAEYCKALIRLALIEGDSHKLLADKQKIFDILIRSYDKYYYMPFMQLAGVMSSETSFISYSKKNIAYEHYYTNYEVMYNFARFFAVNGDKERALRALSEAEKAVRSNGSGSLSILDANNIPSKEIHRAGGTTSTETSVVQRISVRYAYLESVYRAEILSELGNYDESAKELEKAEKRYNEMQMYYSELPKEYSYIDKIDDDFPMQILSKALVAKRRMNFALADGTYTELINYYEKVRESLPVQLRRGFFRGYSKNAYIGLIENRAMAFMVRKDTAGFESFLNAVEMMNSRQFRELSGQQTVADIHAIQASLGNDDLIYMVIDAEDKIITAGITNTDKGISIISKPKGFGKSLKVFKDKLINQNIYDMDVLKKLTSEIIEPIASYRSKGNIHAVIDGELSILPLDIYPIGGKMLFEDYKVDYMVTLDKLKKADSDTRLTFLGVADPVYDAKPQEISRVQVTLKRSAAIAGYFAPLPETREEVKAVAAGMISADFLLGNDASESLLKSMPLSKYSVIHFATHGILGGELPDMDEPALVLSGEKGEDSLLTASEIASLKLDSGLVVLSACNTGSGQYFRGEGVTGIARAFKLAGADTVVASLWPVDSMATKTLMELFYKNIAIGMNVPDALYKAKKELQSASAEGASEDRAIKSKSHTQREFKGYSNPYYWSSFVIISS
jgi:CHAT domain-containing protein/tetratricopeptide (TPR) repeat protein